MDNHLLGQDFDNTQMCRCKKGALNPECPWTTEEDLRSAVLLRDHEALTPPQAQEEIRQDAQEEIR